jgi:hypothetical protein
MFIIFFAPFAIERVQLNENARAEIDPELFDLLKIISGRDPTPSIDRKSPGKQVLDSEDVDSARAE